jgi:hypothetical protein
MLENLSCASMGIPPGYRHEEGPRRTIGSRSGCRRFLVLGDTRMPLHIVPLAVFIPRLCNILGISCFRHNRIYMPDRGM